jgi:hypothetical protein
LESEKGVQKNKRIFCKYPGKWGTILVKITRQYELYGITRYKNSNGFSGKVFGLTVQLHSIDATTQKQEMFF